MSQSKYQHYCTYNEQNKGASLVFDEIKKKNESGLICFLGIKNKNLPASSVFQKSGLRNTCLFIFLAVENDFLFFYHLLIVDISIIKLPFVYWKLLNGYFGKQRKPR